MSDAPTVSGPPADDLQFEHAEYTASTTAATCTSCRQPLEGHYFAVNGQPVCQRCRDQLQQALHGGPRFGRFSRAAIFGSVMALLGAGIYYGVREATGYEFGLISILVGVMVGKAVKKGSNARGGLFYQGLAAFITYTAIVVTYIPPLIQAIAQHNGGAKGAGAGAPAGGGAGGGAGAGAGAAKADQRAKRADQPAKAADRTTASKVAQAARPAGASGDPAGAKLAAPSGKPAAPTGKPATADGKPATAGKSATAEAKPAPAAKQPADEVKSTAVNGKPAAGNAPQVGEPKFRPSLIKFVAALVLLVGLAYAIPILIGFQSPMGLIIIAIGLWEAWAINRRPRIVINGPFQLVQLAPGSSAHAEPAG